MSIWQRSRAVVQSSLRLPGGLPQSIRGRPFANEYRLDVSEMDVALARALYSNTEPRYKLGAGFARPAINVPVGFMGVPQFTAERGGDAQSTLERLAPTWSGSILRAHTALLRDGSVLLRVRPANRSPAYANLFDGEPDAVEIGYHTAESFDVYSLDEDRGAITEVKITHATLVDVGGHLVEKRLFEIVTPDVIRIEWEDNFRPARVERNPLGFVNAVVLRNDNEEHELHGRSELEPIEPYMRFYNDVMLHAGSASKLHSTAKLIIRVKDVNTFLKNNFTDAEIADGRLVFKDKDILFFQSGEPTVGVTGGNAFAEGADIIQARAPLGDTNTLLEYIFLNIVDVSEVPEWAFGGAIASSKASVTEQSAPLIHKVLRKRTLVENAWALVGRMALAMVGQKSAVTISWDDLAQRDTKSEAEALKAISDAVIALVDAEVISKITAVEYLRPFMPALLEYIVSDGVDSLQDERSRIEKELEDRGTNEQDILNALLGPGTEEDDRQAGLRAIG